MSGKPQIPASKKVDGRSLAPLRILTPAYAQYRNEHACISPGRPMTAPAAPHEGGSKPAAAVPDIVRQS